MLFDGSIDSNGNFRGIWTVTDGYQGHQGSQGDIGSQGNQGFQGAVGNQGSQGAQGNQGVQGSQGFQGAAPIGSIGCRVRNTSGYNLDNDVATPLTWDTDDYDTSGMHSTSSETSKIVVPSDGKYLIWTNIAWESNSSGRRFLYITVNGVETWARAEEPFSGTLYWTLSTVTNLTTNQYVEIVAQQSAGVIGITPIYFGVRKIV